MTRRRSSLPSAQEEPRASRRRSPRWALALWWLALVAGVVIVLAALRTYARYFQGVNVLIPDVPPGAFAVLSGLASLLTCLTCLTLAGVLFRRKRNEPMALFVSFYLIAYGVVMSGPIEFIDSIVPGASGTAVSLIQPVFLGVPTIALLVFFPDGRAVPRWSRWLIPVAAISLVFLPWLDEQSGPFRMPTGSEALTWILMATTTAGGIYAQAYRYRRVSASAERHQTRWVLSGFVAWFVLVFLQGVPYAYLGSLPAGAPTPAWASATAALWFLSLSFVPISLAIAVLRYRLYDIDVIINRALVYGGLTAILAGLYAASISLFQRLFTAVTGNKSDAAIVLTTLVLASVFTPLRTRLQAAVDRRFKDVHDPARRLRALTEEVRQGIWILNARQATIRLLTEAADAFSASGGAAFWRNRRREDEIGRVGEWKPPGSVGVEVATPQRVLGRIALGPKQDGSAYSAEDTTALGEAAAAVALAALGSAAPTKGSTRRPIRRTARRTPRPIRRSTRR